MAQLGISSVAKRPLSVLDPRIVVVGSCNTDLIIRSPELPRPGQTVLGGEFSILPGGKGANQAVAAARAGAQVTFVGNIGQDRFGDEALARLRREGIDTRYLVRSRSASGVALILVNQRGENLISVAGSSNDELSPAHIVQALPAIRRARCLVVQLETPLPAVRKAVEIAGRYGVRVLLNPAPAIRLPKSLLRQIEILTPNEIELAALTARPPRGKGTRHLERAAGELVAAGVKHVLVTRGPEEVCWCSERGERWFAVPKVQAIDTVGAGDCFSGALASAIAEDKSMEESIRFAIAAAAISVTRRGAQPSMPTRREIVRSLKRDSHTNISA
jgi:ribokinase